MSITCVYLTHNFDILCLSETYLDSIITSTSNDINLTTPGRDLYRAGHPSNVKRGGEGVLYLL